MTMKRRMKTKNSPARLSIPAILGHKLLASVVLLTAVIALVSGEPAARASQAQFPGRRKDKERPQKNLSGQVVDKAGKGLSDAIVFLKDKKTLEMKTHISDEKGEYRFSGLDPNSDYEVHAERKGVSSPKRGVSSFDDRREVYLVLELDAASE
jgi:hypothetical protein